MYPDDAADIKSHPFFRGIQWDRLHLSKPPILPKVKNQEDTTWFNHDWWPVSDIDGTPGTSSIHEDDLKAQEELEEGIVAAFTKDMMMVDGGNSPAGNIVVAEQQQQHARRKAVQVAADVLRKQGKPKGRERKLPRDPILRDKRTVKQVLAIRTRGAFQGYTYRRPRAARLNIRNWSAEVQRGD